MLTLEASMMRHRSLATERSELLVVLTAVQVGTAALRDALRSRGKLRCARRSWLVGYTHDNPVYAVENCTAVASLGFSNVS